MQLVVRFSLVILIGMMVVFSYSPPALAQDDIKKDYFAKDTVVVIADRVGQIPKVSSIATKLDISIRQTPASIGVVTSALFQNQNAIVLSDALKNISGMFAQTNFGVHDYFVIRGFDSLTSGLVLTDGAAEPEATYYNLYNLERIEVLKGPGAFLYGGNPLSGTVNLIRKQPVYKDFLYASSSFGHFNSYRTTVDLGLSDIEKGIAFRLNGLWQQSDNYRDDKEHDNISVNPALQWRIGNRTVLNLNVEYADSEHQPDSGLPIINNQLPEVPRDRSYQSPLDNSNQEILRGRFDFEHRFSRSFLLRNKLYFTELEWKTAGTLLLQSLISNTNVDRFLSRLDDKQRLGGNQLEAVFHFDTGRLAHQMVAGFEASRLSDEYTLGADAIPPIDLFDPVERTTAESVFFLSETETEARRWTYSPYLVNQIAVSEWAQVLLGGRLDVIDYTDDRIVRFFDAQSQSVFSFAETHDRSYEKFSPMAGITILPTDDISFYANAGRAFAPPSTQSQGDDLQPERSEQLEAGAKLQTLGGKMNASVALFHLQKEDMAISEFGGQVTGLGEQRSRGVEFDLAYQPQQSWQLFLNYAYTDAELLDFKTSVLTMTADGQLIPREVNYAGNSPAFAPEHLFRFWTNKEFQLGLGIGTGLNYISHQYIDARNGFEIDSYLTLDAVVYYNLGGGRVSLNFSNVTGTEYETRGFGASSVIPAQKFAAFGKLEITL